MGGVEDDSPTIVSTKQPTMTTFAEFLKQPSTTTPDASLVLGAARDPGLLLVRHLLVESNGDVQFRGPRGETLLHMAAEGGDVELLEYLCTLETPLHDKDSDHATPLHYAGRQGNKDAVRFLLERGLDLDAVDGHGETCLQIAARRGHYVVMELLVDKGAEYEVCPGVELNEDQQKAYLLCAAFAGSLESVRLLVEMGTEVNNRDAKRVDVNAKDDKGRTGMWIASAKGHLNIVKLLVENGASMTGDKEDNTPLHEAARAGKIDVVSHLIPHVDDINVQNNRGQTALVLASYLGHLEVVKEFVKNGASLVGDNEGYSPFHMAAQEGKVEVVSFLTQHVENINVGNSHGQTALSLASSNGRVEVVKVLVENGATMVGDKDGDTPLHLAAWAGEGEVVSLLVKRVDDINVVNSNDQNALSIASFLGHLDIVKVLVENEASVVSDSIWFSPIHVAAEEGKVEVVSFLIQYVNDINVKDKKGLSALILALNRGQLDVVKVLVENGATMVGDKIDSLVIHKAAREGNAPVVAFLLQHLEDINIANDLGQTALGIASIKGHLDVVKLLVQNGASMVGDSNGNSPLHLAASEGYVEVVSFLIQFVDDINEMNNDGQTALGVASYFGHLEVVKMLVDNGASIFSDMNGNFPLYISAQEGQVEVVSFLLQHVGDINAVNKNGDSALNFASFSGRLNVVKLLVGNGASMVGDKFGSMPIHKAAQNGKIDVLTFLIKNVEDINVVNNFGHTALGIASVNNQLEVVQLLVQNGASIVGDRNGNSPLHLAASEGYVEVVSFLIQHVDDINEVNNDGQTALGVASYLGQVEVVKVLVENGASMVGDQVGDAPIHAAAEEGKVEVVSFLIQHVDDINVVNNNGQTALHVACFHGRLDVLKVLVGAGASMVGDNIGFSPLHAAAQGGNVETITYLMQHFEDINEQNIFGRTALVSATFLGFLDIVKLLVENGASMVRDEDGDTPLHHAVRGGKLEVILYLIEHVVDINAVNESGKTALVFAAYLGQVEVVKVLVENGASMVCDQVGDAPIHAAAEGGKVEVVSFLIQHVEDINAKNNCDVTALCRASFLGHLEVVKVLVENGASMVCDKDGDTPLHLASGGGKVEVVSFLLQHVEDINLVNMNGQTALYVACLQGHLDVVKVLVEAGATMGGDKDGFSPLHAAAQGDHVETITYLIQHVDDINVVNNDGLTALNLASYFGHLEVAKVLVENGAGMVADEDEDTPLHVAALEGNADVVSFLIQHVEDVNPLNKKGLSPFVLAFVNGEFDVVKLLLENGRVMIGDKDGNTALHLAARTDNKELTAFLLQFVKDVNEVNYRGETALVVAMLNGNLDIVDLLVANGASMAG